MSTALRRLSGNSKDLGGGLTVRRLLPAPQCRMVGPFVFFDHFGPVTLAADADSDVGGHPHIGLATVSYLFDGRMVHRDSLGTVQTITPGAVNWMAAGAGIMHSERSHADDRGRPRQLHGLQLWVALPAQQQATPPTFQHVPAAELPMQRWTDGAQARLLLGQAWGLTSPVRTASPTLYVDLTLPPAVPWVLPALAPAMALYSPATGVQVDGEALPAGEMLVLPAGSGAALQAGPDGARLVVIGGAPLQQPVRLWWNFVATDRERLAAAARRWADGGFGAIPGETDRIAAPPWRD